MILRMWHGKTKKDKADAYQRFLITRAIPDYRSIPGNLDVSILRSDEGSESHFLTITQWDSEESIRDFAGNDISKGIQKIKITYSNLNHLFNILSLWQLKKQNNE